MNDVLRIASQAADRLTALTHTHNGALLARYAYTLDAAGNRTRVTETVNGVTREISYTYDALYRLIAADYSTGETYGYQYDPVGNRVAYTLTTPLDGTAVTTYTYDAANRLLVAGAPGHSVAYTWDARGNLLSDGTFTYTYSAAGRMVRVESITATLVYTYNADGLRVAQAQSVASVQSVDTFTWDWATPVPELLSDGESLYLIGYDTLCWQTGTAWTFVLPDALGSVRQETDATGAVTAAREWSPYGEEIDGAQAGLGFTGEWYDANVGLTYLRARWYDGTVGRFVSEDQFTGDSKYPNKAHHFAYAWNNPIQWRDPSGFSPEIQVNCDNWPNYLGGIVNLQGLCRRASGDNYDPDVLDAREQIYWAVVAGGYSLSKLGNTPFINGGPGYYASAYMLEYFLLAIASPLNVELVPNTPLYDSLVQDPGILRATKKYLEPYPGLDEPERITPLLHAFLRDYVQPIANNQFSIEATSLLGKDYTDPPRNPDIRPRPWDFGWFGAIGHVYIDGTFSAKPVFDIEQTI